MITTDVNIQNRSSTSSVLVAVALARRSVALVTLPTQVMMNGARRRRSSTKACREPISS